MKKMAEAHGNRTHPPRGIPRGTTVLKTAEGTSPRALPPRMIAEHPDLGCGWMVRETSELGYP